MSSLILGARTQHSGEQFAILRRFSKLTMSETNNIVLTLNMQAMAFLASGDYMSAIRSCRSAIRPLRASLEDMRDCAATSTATTTTNLDQYLQIFPSDTEGCARLVDNGDAIFDQGYMACHTFGHPDDIPLLLSELDKIVLSAVIFFNMALAHHLLGLARHNVGDIQKARDCYRHARHICSQLPTETVDASFELTLLQVAIGNNLCSTLAMFHDYKEVAYHLKWAMWNAYQLVDDVPFFWLNAIFWDHVGASPAAAA